MPDLMHAADGIPTKVKAASESIRLRSADVDQVQCNPVHEKGNALSLSPCKVPVIWSLPG
ncbi:MAG: hypothetical protein R3C44_04365 [Chloroflexota bacterium]